MLVVVGDRAYKIARGLVPKGPVLSQNVPNPFNATTEIRFHLPADLVGAGLRLAIYNLLGQVVADLPLENLRVGENRVGWDGTDDKGRPVASGLYIYRLAGNGFAVSRQMLMLK